MNTIKNTVGSTVYNDLHSFITREMHNTINNASAGPVRMATYSLLWDAVIATRLNTVGDIIYSILYDLDE